MPEEDFLSPQQALLLARHESVHQRICGVKHTMQLLKILEPEARWSLTAATHSFPLLESCEP